MIKTRTFSSTDELIRETEALLRHALAIPGNLMLSGGSTPCVIYNRIAADPCPVHPKRWLFLSDERLAPFDSEKNNARNLEPMLNALNCADRFIRVDTALDRAKAADTFENDLMMVEEVDIGFLGMGADGHTAGFFTLEQASMKDGSLTLHTDRPDGMEGVSVTPAFLKRVRQIILLVTAESKREIINTLLNDPLSIAAGMALNNHPRVELWTDLTLI
jgi:6-phosphogluconolactonase/glucosamine-6-phosphate isomerase/deaminase